MPDDRPLIGDPTERLAKVVLRELRDARGSRYLEATRHADGGIQILGQDLGSGVEEIFGAGLREYEWYWNIEPTAVPAVIAALDGREDDDPLYVLAAWSVTHSGVDPGSHLQKAGVPIEFWSRVGD
jgi:hypothetical protein